MGNEIKYPLGIQTFAKVIQEDLLYVDKTALIHDLVSRGSVYFFSRPRRFGKSLLISTLEALFAGQREWFKGLAIDKTDFAFTVHPIIKLEFTKDEYHTADNLRESIDVSLGQIAKRYDITLETHTYNQRFDELVVKLHEKTGQKVVLLVDEYDKPILNNLGKSTLAEIKQVMSSFYAVAKSLDEHLKFVFITGVSKFAKVSVFSGMNSLTDISMDPRYSALCGITETELQQSFAAPIAKIGQAQKLERPQLLAQIKHWYNGYRFAEDAEGVYNPYSVLSLFHFGRFDNYWFHTATPTFLLKLIAQQQFDLSQIKTLELDRNAFASIDTEDMDILVILVQTGYLTIVNYEDGWYHLDYPNFEVKQSFNNAIVKYFGKIPGAGSSYIKRLYSNLLGNDLDSFFDTLSVFFANVPYDISLKHEKYYQTIFYSVFTLLGYNLQVEVTTNQGRIDCVLQNQRQDLHHRIQTQRQQRASAGADQRQKVRTEIQSGRQATGDPGC